MSSERRIQERFSLDLQAKISYKFTDDDPEEFIETVAANMSSGGAFLQTDKSIPLASKVKVEFLIAISDLKKLKFILSVDTLRSIISDRVWVQATGVVIRATPGKGIALIFDKNYQLTPMTPVIK